MLDFLKVLQNHMGHIYMCPPPSPSELAILLKPISPRAGGGLFNPESAKGY
jgi:hypothetical protein